MITLNPVHLGINLETGNGEIVLHLVARSEVIWKSVSNLFCFEMAFILIGSLFEFQNTPGKPSVLSAQSQRCQRILEQNTNDLPPIVLEIFRCKPKINDPDDEGRTPLHLAVQFKRDTYAQKLIEEHADRTVKILSAISLFCNSLNQTIFKQ
jgi:hypothetical protein